ncbi:MAG: serine acetyltransferase [Deltaproteobacteria bacterium]|nr:serine acetyltransferase [Deltaproteobacteria bacterium]
MTTRATWEIARIVGELRELRGPEEDEAFWAVEDRRAPPARDCLARVVAGVREVLFPEYFGPPTLTDQGVDYFVGHTLDATLRLLIAEITKELRLEVGAEPAEARATEMAGLLAERIPALRRLLDSDLEAAFAGDPAARSRLEILVCYPGLTALLHHRVAHELYRLGAPLVARLIAEVAHSITAIDIHPGATIGPSFFIDHGTGVVIGETTEIGRRVRLYQGVTLGARNFPVDNSGEIIRGAPRHPIVEDDVIIYANATVLGRIRLGQGSVIGGAVWLTESVPPGSRVTQAQSRRNDSYFDGGGI